MQQLRSINGAVIWCTRRRIQDIIFAINGFLLRNPLPICYYMRSHEAVVHNSHLFWKKKITLSHIILSISSILLFKGFLLFGFLIFQLKNAPIPLCLSRDKTIRQSDKNAILTSTKILPKKYDNFLVNFQIILSTYKL